MIDLSIRPSRRRAVTAHVVLGLLLQLVFVMQSLVILPLCLRTIGAGPFGFWLASGGVLSWLTIANCDSAGLTIPRCAVAYGRSDLPAARAWFVHGVIVAAGSGAVLLVLLLPVAAFTPAWLGARCTSLGMVASTAAFQAVEGVARAVAMIVGVACLGPIGIPLTGAIVTVCGAGFIERRSAEHRAFPSGGTGRWGWLLRALAASGVACLAARHMPRSDWISWAVGMGVGGVVVAAAILAASGEIRGWIRAWYLQQAKNDRAV